MSKKVPAVKTPASALEVFQTLDAAWRTVFTSQPTKESLCLLLAHWGLETGHGKSMWCYNFGNAKAKAGGAFDYCYFACNEILKSSHAARLAAAQPQIAKVTSVRSDGKSIIWFYPDHPACCFRAFENLQAGVTDHLALVFKRFNGAWPFVISADPAGFCHALRKQNYYTADEAAYTQAVFNVFHRYRKELANVEVASDTAELALPSADFSQVSSVLSVQDAEFCGIHSTFDVGFDEEE